MDDRVTIFSFDILVHLYSIYCEGALPFVKVWIWLFRFVALSVWRMPAYFRPLSVSLTLLTPSRGRFQMITVGGDEVKGAGGSLQASEWALLLA